MNKQAGLLVPRLNFNLMFGLFKKKSPIEKLSEKYKQLLKEAHALSTVDRKASDLKTAEANAVLDEIDRLKQQEGNK